MGALVYENKLLAIQTYDTTTRGPYTKPMIVTLKANEICYNKPQDTVLYCFTRQQHVG